MNLPPYGERVQEIVGLEPSPELLAMAQRAADGLTKPVSFIGGSAERISIESQSVDTVVTTWTLCSIADAPRALSEMRRVLKPGGKLLVLEFSKVWEPLKKPYDVYSFSVLPWMGQKIAGDADSYRYLAESIRMHPDQETLKTMLQQAGCEDVEYFNLSGGIVALHKGYKY